MNKMQMEDTARMMISIAEDILDNIENVDFAEVKDLLLKLDHWSGILSKGIGKGT